MSKSLITLCLFLACLSAQAQLQTFKNDTTGTLVANRYNVGVGASGRLGYKGNSGNFIEVPKLLETVLSVNGKTGNNPVLNTGDLSESTNLFFTNARARLAISSTSTAIAYNNATGVFSFAGTKADVGLPLVDNTADAQKPVSTPQQNALNLKQDASQSIYRTNVATYAALTSLTVPSGTTYLVQVASDESQSSPYNSNQWYLKDNTGLTFKLSLIKQ